MTAPIDPQLQRARHRLMLLDRERAEVRARIAELERRTRGPRIATAEGRVALFASLFRGRPDVFATRWESRTQAGRSGWAPKCQNEWRPGICEKPRVKCTVCTQRRFVAYSEAEVRRHLEGRQTIGIYPLLADETCRLVAIDLDGVTWREDADALRESAAEAGVPVLVERSRSGRGAHVWVLFSRPVAARVANGKAMVELEEQLDAVRAGTWRTPEEPTVDRDDPTFRAYASSWLEDNMLEWRSNTVKDVRWRVESHLLPLIGQDRLSTFDIPRVTSVKTGLLKESRRVSERIEAGIVDRDEHNMAVRPLGNESINKCLALLGWILDDAVERGYLRDNPARRVKRLRHHRPRRPVLEPHEVRAMLEAADRLDLRRAGVSAKSIEVAELRREGLSYPQIAARLSISLSTAHHRWTRFEQAGDPIPFFRVWVRVLSAAGLRIDEACRARRSDVDLIAKCLRVGDAKTPAGVRTVQLTPRTVADLRRYLQRTAERPDSSPLLPTRNGTRYQRTNARGSIIEPLVAKTNAVLAEQGQPMLRDGAPHR